MRLDSFAFRDILSSLGRAVRRVWVAGAGRSSRARSATQAGNERGSRNVRERFQEELPRTVDAGFLRRPHPDRALQPRRRLLRRPSGRAGPAGAGGAGGGRPAPPVAERTTQAGQRAPWDGAEQSPAPSTPGVAPGAGVERTRATEERVGECEACGRVGPVRRLDTSPDRAFDGTFCAEGCYPRGGQ